MSAFRKVVLPLDVPAADEQRLPCGDLFCEIFGKLGGKRIGLYQVCDGEPDSRELADGDCRGRAAQRVEAPPQGGFHPGAEHLGWGGLPQLAAEFVGDYFEAGAQCFGVEVQAVCGNNLPRFSNHHEPSGLPMISLMDSSSSSSLIGVRKEISSSKSRFIGAPGLFS